MKIFNRRASDITVTLKIQAGKNEEPIEQAVVFAAGKPQQDGVEPTATVITDDKIIAALRGNDFFKALLKDDILSINKDAA